MRARRQLDGEPILTINKTHTHWLHVINQAKANKPSISVHPTGSDATYEAAQVFEGIIRHIEYVSDAQSVYAAGCEPQVGGGIGYWRIVTDYADENSFDQEIFLRPIRDPLAVYMDPPKRKDGSDAKWCFYYEDWDRATFEKKYPNVTVSAQDTDVAVSAWSTNDKVRVAEYYEVEEKKEWMYAIPKPDNAGVDYVRESDMTPEIRQAMAAFAQAGTDLQRRRIDKRIVRWYLIAGNQIVDRNIWAGKYIPIIRVVGEEVVIDGQMDRKGLVRYLKDPQRMYNYNSSAQVQYGALQSKTPYVGPLEAFEGLENYWANANRENYAYLPFNDKDENGNPIEAPTRQPPPQAAEAFTAGMQAAAQEMMMASGQYDATFGARAQELSGVALENRKDQGERATFHYLDNFRDAIRYTGKQLVDLIPKVYDTRRVVLIMAEDGTEDQIQVDPELSKAVIQKQQAQENVIRSIFNPKVGTYDVVSEAGPNYDTRREEAFQAMKELLVGNPALAQVIGDLWMGTADFPSADKLQERMRNWIPKEIQGVGPSAAEQQLTAQLQQAMQVIQALQQQLSNQQNAEAIAKQRVDTEALNHLALRMENERKNIIEVFRAETDRVAKLFKAIPPEMLAALSAQVTHETLETPPIAPNPVDLSGAEAYANGLLMTDLGQSTNPQRDANA